MRKNTKKLCLLAILFALCLTSLLGLTACDFGGFAPDSRPTLTVESNLKSAGTLSGGGRYEYNEDITVQASCKEGYYFLGWYFEDDLLSTSLIYSAKMWNKDVVLEAKFIALPEGVSGSGSQGTQSSYSLSVVADNPLLGSVNVNETGLKSKYSSSVPKGNTVKAVALTTSSRRFLGWYDEADNLVMTNASFSFSMPYFNYELRAKWDCKSCPSLVIENGCFKRIATDCPTCGKSYSTIKKVTIPNTVTSIGGEAFKNYTALQEVTIPNSVTSIGSSAFYGCSKLTSIMIGNSVTSIGNSAFYNCSSLTSIMIPDGVTSIPSSAFYNCDSLTSITLGNNVTSIGYDAFSGCSRLTSITVAEGNQKYHSEGNCLIETATNTLILGCNNSVIPNYVTSIGDGAFFSRIGLTSITIPDSVTSIGDDAFRGCGLHTKVNYTGTIDQWVQISFGNSTANPICYTKDLYINDKLVTKANITTATKINAYAFYDCSSLTSVTIGNSVISIGDDAFSGCDSLTSITIPDSVTSIGYGAFSGCSYLNSITIPFVGGSETATSSSSSTLFGYIFGTSSYYGGTATKQYYSGSSYSTYYIPSSLKSVTVTGGNILYGAFYNCKSLTSVTIGNGVTSIGYRAFDNCSSLTSVTIGNSVTSIGYEAFYNCWRLTSVTIGNSVTSIGSYAFSDCSSLTSVTYNGTKAQWNAISKVLDWKYRVPSSCKVHCTDGTVDI